MSTLLNIEGVAVVADCSARTVERDLKRGNGPAVMWIGDLRRFTPESANDYAARRRQRRT